MKDVDFVHLWQIVFHDEIHDVSSPSDWRYIPSELNPADDGTREMKIEAFHPTCRWWMAPSFLWQPDECWPNQHVDDVTHNDTELLAEKYVMIISPSATLVQFLCKSSSWLRLQRQMAWLLRFIQFLKNPVALSAFPRMITLTEMRVSSLKIVHIIQRQYFPEELGVFERANKFLSTAN